MVFDGTLALLESVCHRLRADRQSGERDFWHTVCIVDGRACIKPASSSVRLYVAHGQSGGKVVHTHRRLLDLENVKEKVSLL